MKMRKLFWMLMLAAMPAAFVGCNDTDDPTVDNPGGDTPGGDAVAVPTVTFRMTVSGEVLDGFTVKITPSDNDADWWYRNNVIDKETLDADYEGDIARYVDSEIDRLDPEVLGYRLRKGEQTQVYEDLTPDTEYVVFAVGVNIDGKSGEVVRGEVFSTQAKTASLLGDDVVEGDFKLDLEFEYTEYDGKQSIRAVNVTVTPGDPDMWYVCNYADDYRICDPTDPDYMGVESWAYQILLQEKDLRWNRDTMPTWDWTAEFVNGDITERLLYKGTQTFHFEGMAANPFNGYAVYVVGVIPDGENISFATTGIVSEPFYVDDLGMPGDDDDDDDNNNDNGGNSGDDNTGNGNGTFALGKVTYEWNPVMGIPYYTATFDIAVSDPDTYYYWTISAKQGIRDDDDDDLSVDSRLNAVIDDFNDLNVLSNGGNAEAAQRLEEMKNTNLKKGDQTFTKTQLLPNTEYTFLACFVSVGADGSLSRTSETFTAELGKTGDDLTPKDSPYQIINASQSADDKADKTARIVLMPKSDFRSGYHYFCFAVKTSTMNDTAENIGKALYEELKAQPGFDYATTNNDNFKPAASSLAFVLPAPESETSYTFIYGCVTDATQSIYNIESKAITTVVYPAKDEE